MSAGKIILGTAAVTALGIFMTNNYSGKNAVKAKNPQFDYAINRVNGFLNTGKDRGINPKLEVSYKITARNSESTLTLTNVKITLQVQNKKAKGWQEIASSNALTTITIPTKKSTDTNFNVLFTGIDAIFASFDRNNTFRILITYKIDGEDNSFILPAIIAPEIEYWWSFQQTNDPQLPKKLNGLGCSCQQGNKPNLSLAF